MAICWRRLDQLGVEPFPGRALAAAGRAIRPSEVGSNALAIGGDATQNAGGLLLGNPHQPWNGSGRWYEAHLTIPGEYDVAGASLQGLPWIGIGFTKDVAWTHTVDYSTRFTLYELKLNPDNPMEYEYDGQWREITSETVSVKVTQPDGSVTEEERTFYSSHYGLIVDLGGVNPLLGGWPMFNGSILSIRDANLETGIRSAQQWVKKSQATNMAEFTEALKAIGNPVFHEFAADRHGDAFYGQLTAVPHLTRDKLDRCIQGVGALLADATSNAIFGMDGSTSDCEWGEDADSPPGTGLFGYEARPKILTRGVVGNSNNSYWLSDANNPLTGYPFVLGWMGPEGKQQFLRTRITHLMIAQRLAEAGVALDAPWGEVQFLERNNERVPIHGGAGTMGVFGAISASLKEGGYKNPGSGNSYIQTVTWDESDCPIADTILTHSQSVQPDSDYYSDQSKLYADKRWVRFPFCEEDIVAQQVGETLVLEE